MDLKSLKRDAAHSEAGEWVADIPGMGDLRLRVRGLGSKTYKTVSDRLARAVPREGRLRDGALKPEVATRITGQAAAEALLFDWEGIADGGEVVEYSRDKAVEMLTDPNFEPFLSAVLWAANVVENGRAENAEALEKN